MLSSTTGVFREPDDFEAILRGDGGANLIVTGSGRFRARLIRIVSYGLRLLTVQEDVARTAFFSIPCDTLQVSVPIGHSLPLIWGGIDTRPGEVVTLGGGYR